MDSSGSMPHARSQSWVQAAFHKIVQGKCGDQNDNSSIFQRKRNKDRIYFLWLNDYIYVKKKKTQK